MGLKKVALYMAKRLKGYEYIFDEKLLDRDLFHIGVVRVSMLIKGTWKRIWISDSHGFLFLGKRSKLVSLSRIKFNGTTTIQHDSVIDARVRQQMSFGNNFSLGPFSIIEGFGVLNELGESLSIGNNVGIAGHSIISIRGPVTIGDDVIIGPFFSLHSEEHIFSESDKPIRSQGVSRKGVHIAENVWIGAKVTILDGVSIGEGTVIGAGSVVTHSLPSNVVAVGVPARVVRKRVSSGKE
jgi:acetyltransferase-like isoleucine patch superfamily enzyme